MIRGWMVVVGMGIFLTAYIGNILWVDHSIGTVIAAGIGAVVGPMAGSWLAQRERRR